MTSFLPALLAALVTAVPAAAASLRASTTLEAPVVRLSDLFDDAGPRAERVLGPAPAPGSRIVVEAPQLGAIARQFGVDWRPTGSERIVLERPGRMLPREQVLDALRAALSGVGASDDAECELPGFVAPTVPLDGEVNTAVEQLDYDAATGRFTASLVVSGKEMGVQRMRLSGRLQRMVDVPVLTRRLPTGAVLRPGDVRLARVRAGAARGEPLASPEAAMGMSLRHPGVPGTPLMQADVTRPPMVEKGSRVLLELAMPGLALSGQGVALESGPAGATVQVQNPLSRAVLEGVVVAPNVVRVSPGSMPLASGRPGTKVATR